MPDILVLPAGLDFAGCGIVLRGDLGVEAQTHPVEENLVVAKACIQFDSIRFEERLPVLLSEPPRKAGDLNEIVAGSSSDHSSDHLGVADQRSGNFVECAIPTHTDNIAISLFSIES